jgi:hypothetical protein
MEILVRDGWSCSTLKVHFDIAHAVERYFHRDLCAQLASRGSDIKEFALKRHFAVAQITIEAYAEVLGLPVGAGTSLIEQSDLTFDERSDRLN